MSALQLRLVGGSGAGAEGRAGPWDTGEGAGSDGRGEGGARVSLRMRLIDAALVCLARNGVGGTTVDEVAREAGCSRATFYRAFPGGREELIGSVAETELARFCSVLAVRVSDSETLEEALTGAMTDAAVTLAGHGVLRRLLEREPSVILPHLTFGHLDQVLGVVSTVTAPFLVRWLELSEARRVAEWAARIVLSYLLCPQPGVDLRDPARTRWMVRTFMMPGIAATIGSGGLVGDGGAQDVGDGA